MNELNPKIESKQHTYHTSSHGAGEGSLIFVINLLTADAKALGSNDVFYFGEERIRGEEHYLGAAFRFVNGAGVFHFVEEADEAIGEVQGVGFCGGVHLFEGVESELNIVILRFILYHMSTCFGTCLPITCHDRLTGI